MGRSLHALTFVAAESADKNNPDRTAEPLREVDLGSDQTQEREPFEPFRQQVDGVFLGNMRRRSARQHAKEAKGKLVFDRMEMAEKPFAISLLDVHGRDLGPNYSMNDLGAGKRGAWSKHAGRERRSRGLRGRRVEHRETHPTRFRHLICREFSPHAAGGGMVSRAV